MLETLQLSNFKSIKSGYFQLENLTLFSGRNGMGKSSVLQSILLLRQSYEAHLLPNVGLSLAGQYVRIGRGKDLMYTEADEEFVAINCDWTTSDLHLRFQYNETSDVQPVASFKTSVGVPFSEPLFTSSFQYLSAERISPKSVYDVSDYAVNQQRSLGMKGEFTAHFLSVHGDDSISIPALQHSKASTTSLLDNINAWMSDITPGTKVVANLIPEINQASLHYQFATATQMTEKFRPENTGFGLTYVLPVVTAVLSARTGDMLLIENPESHLHPAGQTVVAKLISLAAESGIQVIVETHSDHFLNGVRTSTKARLISHENVRIYFLSRNPASEAHEVQIENVDISENGKLSHWPEGFFDEWERSLDILISGAE